MNELIEDFPISKRVKTALKAAGYICADSLRNKYAEDVKDIDGLGQKGWLELREYLYNKYRITFKPKPKPKKTKNFLQSRQLVEHFFGKNAKIFWGKEIKVADQLISIYGFELLSSIRLNKKIYSLSYFFTQEGKACIKQARPALSIETAKPTQPAEDTGEAIDLFSNVNIQKAPKSIRDFL
jgi:hypothetical protein